MTSVICIGDIHLSDRPPSNCTPAYNDQLFEMLADVVHMSYKHDAVVFAGDIFHSKIPHRTSHRTVQRMIEVVHAFSCPVYIVPGNHDMCVSDDTECLTDHGWLRRSDLRGTELFATLDPVTHEFIWQRPNKIFVSHYSGDLLHFINNRVDHLVTPNHELVVRPSLELAHGSAEWRKVRADEIPSYTRWYAPAAAEKWGGSSPVKVVVPPSARCPGLELNPELAADLFGWYLSEGSVESEGRITISQSAKSPHRTEIENLVSQLGFEPSTSSLSTIRFCSAPLARFLAREFGEGSYEKRIPSWVKDWSSDLLSRVFWAYKRGDGNTNGSSATVLTTASDKLVDDLQEVCAKLGLVSNSGTRQYATVYGYESSYRRVRVSWGRAAGLSVKDPRLESYDGVVWCPNLDNGIWLTRRNGKVIWTGNSNDRLDSIHETQPFGVLLRAGARLLNGWATDFPLYGVPWQQDWDTFLREDALVDWVTEGDARWGSLSDCLLVTHAPIYPRGRENPWECIPASEFACAMQTGSCYYGHVHDHHGSYIEYTDGGQSQVHFCNQGSLSRGCLQEEDLNRVPAVTVWASSASGTPFFRVELASAPPASEVFRLAEAATQIDYRARMDEFLTAVGSSTVSQTSVDSVLAHLQTLGLSEGERALAEEVLASAAAGELP